MKLWICVILLPGFLIRENLGLFCHTCLKFSNNSCLMGKNPSQTILEICPSIPDNEKALGASPLCFKIIKWDKNNETSASRGCTYAGGSTTAETFCANITRLSDNSTTCQTCRTDGCNKAQSKVMFMPLLFLAGLTSLFLVY